MLLKEYLLRKFRRETITAKSGFTLIELLVVIAIIGLVSAIVMLAINPAEILRDSRDKKRMADLRGIYDALERYALDAGQYPGETYCDSSIGSADHACPVDPPQNNWDKNSSFWTQLTGSGQMGIIPADPTNDIFHFYYYEPLCNQDIVLPGGTIIPKCSKETGGNGLCCAYYLGCNFEDDEGDFVWVYTP